MAKESEPNLESVLLNLDRHEASAAVLRLGQLGMFNNPMPGYLQRRVTEEVFREIQAFNDAAITFIDVVRDNRGWTDSEAELLGMGFDLALVVLDEMVREQRRFRVPE